LLLLPCPSFLQDGDSRGPAHEAPATTASDAKSLRIEVFATAARTPRIINKAPAMFVVLMLAIFSIVGMLGETDNFSCCLGMTMRLFSRVGMDRTWECSLRFIYCVLCPPFLHTGVSVPCDGIIMTSPYINEISDRLELAQQTMVSAPDLKRIRR